MLLGAFTARFDHGLLVVSASESTDRHDDWDAATEAVHAGPDSLYIGVRDTVTGLVSVTCREDDVIETELRRHFTGNLDLPSARLKLYDPDESIMMTIPVQRNAIGIVIYSDDEMEPSELLIQLIG